MDGGIASKLVVDFHTSCVQAKVCLLQHWLICLLAYYVRCITLETK